MPLVAGIQSHVSLKHGVLEVRHGGGCGRRRLEGQKACWRKDAAMCHLLRHRKQPRMVSRARHSINIVNCKAVEEIVPDNSVTAVLLSGGVGKRMGAKIPKQYLDVHGEAIATYSLRTMSQMREIGEIVIVCDPSWRHVFEDYVARFNITVPIVWAEPGKERTDSAYNGLMAAREGAALIAFHDAARPLVQAEDISNCFLDGWKTGAALLGVRVKPTLKEIDGDMSVKSTVPRENLWEAQTPQVIKIPLMKKGYELLQKQGVEATDDVSLIEALGHEVKLTEGSYTNIKVTTPEDLSVAEIFLKKDAEEVPAVVRS